MKVYIVTRGEYSDYHIEAIFSTEEDATKYCALHNDRTDYACEIEEWDVDDVKFEGDINLGYEYAYYGKYESDDKFKPVNPRYIELQWPEWRKVGPMVINIKDETTEFDFKKKPYFYLYVRLKERNDERALKIARDRLAKINAQLSGV